MFAGMKGLTIQMLMLLHIGQIDEQVKRGSRQHILYIRIVMRDFEASRLALGPLRFDVAGADQLNVWTSRKMR